MKSNGKQGTFVQCQCCGNIYLIPDEISIEKSLIKSDCPMCSGHVGLNCGYKKEDVYIYMNLNLDDRYYNY